MAEEFPSQQYAAVHDYFETYRAHIARAWSIHASRVACRKGLERDGIVLDVRQRNPVVE